MTTEFKELGFQFLYPENWTVTKDASQAYPRSVTVQSPSGAFWSVTADRSAADELVQRVGAAIADEYEGTEVHEMRRKVGPLEMQGQELNFYCLDLLVTAQVLGWEKDGLALAILMQAENREFEELSRVFDAMTFSLLKAGG